MFWVGLGVGVIIGYVAAIIIAAALAIHDGRKAKRWVIARPISSSPKSE